MDVFQNLSFKNWIALIFDKNNKLFCNHFLREEFIVFTATLYDLLWLNRNKKAHGGNWFNVQELMIKVTKIAKEHWNCILLLSSSTGSLSNHIWMPPPPGWVKVNKDASFIDGKAHTGRILRNNNGSIISAATSSHHYHDALTAESIAILEACKFISNAKINNAIFEADSLNAITFIRSASGASLWTANVIIQEIRKFWHLWPKWRFKFVSRNANCSSHSLANWA